MRGDRAASLTPGQLLAKSRWEHFREREEVLLGALDCSCVALLMYSRPISIAEIRIVTTQVTSGAAGYQTSPLDLVEAGGNQSASLWDGISWKAQHDSLQIEIYVW